MVFFPKPVFAVSIEEETRHLLKETDLTAVEEALPNLNVKELLENALRGEGLADAETWKQAFRKALTGSAEELLPSLLRLCGYAILCITLSLLTKEEGVGTLAQSLLHISALLLPARQAVALIVRVGNTLDGIGKLCGAVTPTVSALLLAEGSVKLSAGGQAVALFVMDTLLSFAQRVLLPLLKGTAVLVLFSAAARNLPLNKLCKLPLSFAKWSCGIGFAAFLGLLTVKGIPAVRYDGVTVRAAKYAVEKLVPVVGGIFKDTTDTLIGCVLLLRGAFGIIVIIGANREKWLFSRVCGY